MTTATTTAVKPRPVLTDGHLPASPNFRQLLLETAATRAWQASPRAADIERGLAIIKARQPITNDGANWLLRYMKATPRTATPSPAQRPRPSDVKIPDGYYMVDGRRFRITTPSEGKWAGRHSVREQLPNDATTWPKGDERTRILSLIAANPDEAGAAYGRATGKCRKCHRLLTDAVSVASGAGPDCRAKYGYPTIQPTA